MHTNSSYGNKGSPAKALIMSCHVMSVSQAKALIVPLCSTSWHGISCIMPNDTLDHRFWLSSSNDAIIDTLETRIQTIQTATRCRRRKHWSCHGMWCRCRRRKHWSCHYVALVCMLLAWHLVVAGECCNMANDNLPARLFDSTNAMQTWIIQRRSIKPFKWQQPKAYRNGRRSIWW